MRKLFVSLVLLALVAAACGGDGSGNSAAEATADATVTADATAPETEATTAAESGVAPSGLPEECIEAPFELEVTADAIAGLDGPFTVDTAFAKPQPIVPDPDQGGESTEQSVEELQAEIDRSKLEAAETDLVLFGMWLADFPFDEGDIGLFGGPDPEPGGTVLGLSIVPTETSGFATGDTISAADDLQYDTFTTFAPMGSYLVTDIEPDASLVYQGEPSGSAKVLHLDENWICVSWDDAGSTRSPDGTISISGVITAPLTAREELPFS
jgi:hypothetical protein